VPGIGMGLAWFGYALAGWGYCLIKGYDVRFADWINPVRPYSGPWPPATMIPPDSVLPGGASGGTAAAGKRTGVAPVAPAPGRLPPGGVGGRL
jgi:hypothetical protein